MYITANTIFTAQSFSNNSVAHLPAIWPLSYRYLFTLSKYVFFQCRQIDKQPPKIGKL